MEESKKSHLIGLRKQGIASQIAKTLYADTQDEACFTCDLIIKAKGYEYYCHKIILASSSKFLWKLLETAVEGTLPVLVLPDINPSIIKYILFYIYNGDVRVPLSKYADFIEACHLLELKGLVDNNQPLNGQEDDMELIADIEDEEDDESVNESSQEKEPADEVQAPADNEVLKDDDELDEGTSIQFVARRRYTKLRNDVIRKRKENMIKLTPVMKKCGLKDVKKVIRSVYKRLNKDVDGELEANINNTKLVMKGKKLIRAEHMCGLCNYTLCLSYNLRANSTLTWANCNLIRHLKNIHGITLKPAVRRGRAKE